MNTRHIGEITLVFVRNSSKKEYLGFCPEFAIVKYGDDLETLKTDLLNATKGYVEAIDKAHLSDELLNRYDELPDEFKDIYQVAKERILRRHLRKKSKISRPYLNAINSGDALLVPACI